MKTRARGTSLLAAAAALGLVLSACGGSSGGASPNPATSDVDASELDTDGVLVVGQAGGIAKLDPNTISSSFAAVLQPLLWNGLTKWDEDMQAVPDLADSWESSADLKTWTFKLRDGVTYHDGRPFTAEDAVANINRVLDPEIASQERVKIEDITTARAVDATTLELQLSAPNAILPAALVEVKMSDVENIETVDRDANGTGPYKLKEFVADTRVVLERNEDYWGEPASAKEIQIVRAADTTAGRTSLVAGDLDILYGMPPADAAALAGELNLLEPNLVSGSATWEVDTTSPPFNDKRARQALSYAMNRQAMLEAAYSGLGDVPTQNNLVNANNAAAASEGLVDYEFDLDRAKELFEEAGVVPGTRFTFWALAGSYDEWVTMGEILQQDLEKIGYGLDIERREVSTWLERFFPAGQQYPGTIVANYLSLPAVPAYTLSFLLTGTCECNWDNPEYNELHKQALAEPDDAARAEIYADMQRLISEEAPVLVAAQATQLSAANSRVQGVWVESDGDLHLENAGVVSD